MLYLARSAEPQSPERRRTSHQYTHPYTHQRGVAGRRTLKPDDRPADTRCMLSRAPERGIAPLAESTEYRQMTSVSFDDPELGGTMTGVATMPLRTTRERPIAVRWTRWGRWAVVPVIAIVL